MSVLCSIIKELVKWNEECRQTKTNKLYKVTDLSPECA